MIPCPRLCCCIEQNVFGDKNLQLCVKTQKAFFKHVHNLKRSRNHCKLVYLPTVCRPTNYTKVTNALDPDFTRKITNATDLKYTYLYNRILF